MSGIALGGGEKRNVDVTLKVGNTSNRGQGDGTSPIQSRRSTPARNPPLSPPRNCRISSRQAATPPNSSRSCRVSASTNGTSNKSNYSGETIGINGNGDAGSQSPLNNAYSYNGLPSNSLDITADGAHVSDPGCNCDTPVNPNSDMISEFKVKMSNFSAENQKGPAVISFGGQVRRQGLPRFRVLLCPELRAERQRRAVQCQRPAQPQNKYYYPGGTIGGPVLIPGTQVQQEAQQALLLHRLRILLPGARHRTASRHGSHTRRDRRQFLAGGSRQGRQHHRLRRPSRTDQADARRRIRVESFPPT